MCVCVAPCVEAEEQDAGVPSVSFPASTARLLVREVDASERSDSFVALPPR